MGKLFSFYSLSCNKKGIPNLVKVFYCEKTPFTPSFRHPRLILFR